MILPAQCRAARALLGWSQQTLAETARIGVATIRNFETGKVRPQYATMDVLVRAFQAAGIEFLDGGVRLPAPPPRKKR